MQGVCESSWYDIKAEKESLGGGDTVKNETFLLSL